MTPNYCRILDHESATTASWWRVRQSPQWHEPITDWTVCNKFRLTMTGQFAKRIKYWINHLQCSLTRSQTDQTFLHMENHRLNRKWLHQTYIQHELQGYTIYSYSIDYARLCYALPCLWRKMTTLLLSDKAFMIISWGVHKDHKLASCWWTEMSLNYRSYGIDLKVTNLLQMVQHDTELPCTVRNDVKLLLLRCKRSKRTAPSSNALQVSAGEVIIWPPLVGTFQNCTICRWTFSLTSPSDHWYSENGCTLIGQYVG